MTCTAERDL